MRVFSDLILDVEYLSDAKRLKKVETKEGEIEGLIAVDCTTIPDPDDDDVDNAEKRLDQLWAFPALNPIPEDYPKFKKFRDDYFKKYVKGLMKVKKGLGHFKEDGAEKAFQAKMGAIMGWIKAEFKNLSFHAAETPVGEYEGKEYFGGLAYCWYAPGATDPMMVYIEEGLREERF